MVEIYSIKYLMALKCNLYYIINILKLKKKKKIQQRNVSILLHIETTKNRLFKLNLKSEIKNRNEIKTDKKKKTKTR